MRDDKPIPTRELPPTVLVFCSKCGCHYTGGCPDEDHPGHRPPPPPPDKPEPWWKRYGYGP